MYLPTSFIYEELLQRCSESVNFFLNHNLYIAVDGIFHFPVNYDLFKLPACVFVSI
jgi:hypothetical protein